MTEKLSEFLAEHKASEFGLAPVSKAYAIKMSEALEQRIEELENLAGWGEQLYQDVHSGNFSNDYGSYRDLDSWQKIGEALAQQEEA